MHGAGRAFYGVVRTPLVRDGVDAVLPDDEHTLPLVYREMFLQVCMDYSTLPDPLGLDMAQIRIFYNGLRPALWRTTKPRG